MNNFLLFMLLIPVTISRTINKYGVLKNRYLDTRNKILFLEELRATGRLIKLNKLEQQANDILLEAKLLEHQKGLSDESTYAAGMHFFQAKDIIDESAVFKILKKMPKGSVLHGHNTAMVTSEWVIKNLTYWPNALKCINHKGITILTFRNHEEHGCTNYVKIADEREEAFNVEAYDNELEKAVNLYTPTPETDYPDIGVVWTKFQNMFASLGDMIKYCPAYTVYHNRLLEEMYEDGVMYMELRTSFSPCYDDSMKQYTAKDTIEEMRRISQEFVASHPNFVGMKTIYSTHKSLTPEGVKEKMDFFKEIYALYSDFIIGFDLVGREDTGRPFLDSVDQLFDLPKGANFFLHAGETNLQGLSTDLNLVDSMLLKAKRIGHGYALMKHPVIADMVKKNDVAIEVSPISSQVLHLVSDMRNHPASLFIANDIPMVVSNDDPGFWNAKGLSYDFYYILMSCTPATAGLRTLKQLVLNSIKYTALTNMEQEYARQIFEQEWTIFLNEIVSSKKYGDY